MNHSYVLVEVEPGAMDGVRRELALLTGVSETTCVVGGFDLIVRAEAEDDGGIGTSLRERIARLRGVTRALPCVVRGEPAVAASAT